VSAGLVRMVQGSPVPRAVVIGAGVAGLAAAAALAAEGWRVVVLEKEDAVGGRCRTVREGDYLFDTGAQHFHDSYDDTLNTAIRAGLGETFRVPHEPKGIYHDGRLSTFVPRELNPSRALPWGALGMEGFAGVGAVAPTLMAHYRSYNIRFPHWWSEGDDITAARFLARRSTARYRRNIADPAALYTMGAGIEEISAAAFMVALRYTFGDRTGAFTGGMGSLPEALARKAKVITGMVATEVVREGRKAAGVRAVPASGGRARTYKGDVVICALPAEVVPAVVGRLGRAAEDVAAAVDYAPAIVVNLALSRSSAAPGGPLMIARGEDIAAAWACQSTSKAAEYAPAGGAVATVVFSGAEVPALIDRQDGTIIDAASAACSKLFGTAPRKPRHARVDRHPLAFPVVSPGHAARVRTLFSAGSGVGNLLLAGDWTTSPTVEGAVSSGLQAAGRALAQQAR
jgi:protoporphyrinogen/coproporphyrinogen III oxidase